MQTCLYFILIRSYWIILIIQEVIHLIFCKTFSPTINFAAPNKTTLQDFWRMLWEKECGYIVMLTNLVESSKV